jgi:hypothetical protein
MTPALRELLPRAGIPATVGQIGHLQRPTPRPLPRRVGLLQALGPHWRPLRTHTHPNPHHRLLFGLHLRRRAGHQRLATRHLPFSRRRRHRRRTNPRRHLRRGRVARATACHGRGLYADRLLLRHTNRRAAERFRRRSLSLARHGRRICDFSGTLRRRRNHVPRQLGSVTHRHESARPWRSPQLRSCWACSFCRGAWKPPAGGFRISGLQFHSTSASRHPPAAPTRTPGNQSQPASRTAGPGEHPSPSPHSPPA